MKYYNNKVIIGTDHGYGNIKTANHTFKACVATFDSEPVFQTNMLTYGGKYYLVGEGHKEFSADKITDGEYFILTLAIIAYEEKRQNEQLVETILAAVRSALSNVQLVSPFVSVSNDEITDKDAAAFKAKCAAEGIPQAQIIKKAIADFLGDGQALTGEDD